MGLNPLINGDIKLDKENITKRPIRDRNMSLVYQQFINYPHLSVLDNVAFPLRRQGKKKAQAQALASTMLTTVGLGDFYIEGPHNSLVVSNSVLLWRGQWSNSLVS